MQKLFEINEIVPQLLNMRCFCTEISCHRNMTLFYDVGQIHLTLILFILVELLFLPKQAFFISYMKPKIAPRF